LLFPPLILALNTGFFFLPPRILALNLLVPGSNLLAKNEAPLGFQMKIIGNLTKMVVYSPVNSSSSPLPSPAPDPTLRKFL
jgi:hypothetical protein